MTRKINLIQVTPTACPRKIVKKGGHPNVALVDESQVDSRGGHRNIALVDETRSAHLLRQLFWNRRYINLHAMQKSKCVKYPCVKVLLHLIYTIVPLRQKTTGNKSMRVKKHYTDD